MQKSGPVGPIHGFAQPVPTDVEVYTTHIVIRKSDGTELGIISQMDKSRSTFSRHTSPKEGGSLSSECETFDNADDGLAWIAANPHLPDVTKDDGNIIRLHNVLLRKICNLPGDAFLCRNHAYDAFSLNAYRSGLRIAYVYPSGRGFRLTIIRSATRDVVYKPTLKQAWTALIRATIPDDPSGHEQLLWRETLKAEKLRIRKEADYPARLLSRVPDDASGR